MVSFLPLTFVAAAPSSDKRQSSAPVVLLDSATIIGSSSNGIDTFKSIPYAQPPVGQLRLKPPQPIIKNLGVILATAPLTQCPQMTNTLNTSALPVNVASDFMANGFLSTAQGQGEDCLTINVQRPSTAALGFKLPVLFWIYGGGFEAGSTQSYDGSSFITTAQSQGKPFIYVAVNYRLGGFGFLAGKELLKDGSTNLGLLDQRLGLQWVADNIAQFGGDPNKVTIWGESAGAIAVFDQMALYDGNNVYKGKPLFRAAIMDSGSTVPADPVDGVKGQAIYDTVVQNAGCAGSLDTLSCLRSVSYDTFLSSVNSLPGIFSYQLVALSYLPRPDYHTLTQSPHVLASTGKFTQVPFIIGDHFDEDEGTLFSLVQPNISTTDQLIDYLHTYFFIDVSRQQISDLVNLYPDDPSAGSPFRTGPLNNIYPQFKRIAAILGDLTFTLTRRVFLHLARTSTVGHVIVWVGEQQLRTKNVLELLMPVATYLGSLNSYNIQTIHLSRDALSLQLPAGSKLRDGTLFEDFGHHSLRQVFADLLNQCTVFTRVWTIQEVVLAAEDHVTVLCGDLRIRWRSFTLLARLIPILLGTGLLGGKGKSDLLGAILRGIAVRHVRQSEILAEGDLALQLVLDDASNSEVTNPRDRVFGILGLVHPFIRQRLKRLGYTTARSTIFRLATELMVEEGTSLHYLGYKQPAYGDKKDLKVPSWRQWIVQGVQEAESSHPSWIWWMNMNQLDRTRLHHCLPGHGLEGVEHAEGRQLIQDSTILSTYGLFVDTVETAYDNFSLSNLSALVLEIHYADSSDDSNKHLPLTGSSKLRRVLFRQDFVSDQDYDSMIAYFTLRELYDIQGQSCHPKEEYLPIEPTIQTDSTQDRLWKDRLHADIMRADFTSTASWRGQTQTDLTQNLENHGCLQKWIRIFRNNVLDLNWHTGLYSKGGRNIFITTAGHVGLGVFGANDMSGTPAVQVGDRIAVFHMATKFIILRPCSQGEYKVVGPGFIPSVEQDMISGKSQERIRLR